MRHCCTKHVRATPCALLAEQEAGRRALSLSVPAAARAWWTSLKNAPSSSSDAAMISAALCRTMGCRLKTLGQQAASPLQCLQRTSMVMMVVHACHLPCRLVTTHASCSYSPVQGQQGEAL